MWTRVLQIMAALLAGLTLLVLLYCAVQWPAGRPCTFALAARPVYFAYSPREAVQLLIKGLDEGNPAQVAAATACQTYQDRQLLDALGRLGRASSQARADYIRRFGPLAGSAHQAFRPLGDTEFPSPQLGDDGACATTVGWPTFRAVMLDDRWFLLVSESFTSQNDEAECSQALVYFDLRTQAYQHLDNLLNSDATISAPDALAVLDAWLPSPQATEMAFALGR